MKKILYNILIVFIAISCTHLDDYDAIDMGTGPDITISVTNVTIDDFTVTISPGSTTGFYSYLVTESNEAENVTPSLVFSGSYSGVAKDVIKYSSENTSTTFTVPASAGTTYQIYAIAGNTNGVLGSLVNSSVTTRTISQEQIVGTYTMTVYSSAQEDYITESNVVIKAISADSLSISNLLEDGTVVYATWDIAGYLYIEDDQYLTDIGRFEAYFANASAAAPVEWRYNENGNIEATGVWGYYVVNPNDDEEQGWRDRFTTTTLTPSSASTGSVQSANSKVQNTVAKELKIRTGFEKNK